MSKRWHPNTGNALKKLASSPGYCDSSVDGGSTTTSTISSPCFLSTAIFWISLSHILKNLNICMLSGQ